MSIINQKYNENQEEEEEIIQEKLIYPFQCKEKSQFNKIFIVTGPAGVGKTYKLRQIMQQVEQQCNVQTFFKQMADLFSKSKSLDSIMNDLNQIFQKFLDCQQSILCFDDFDLIFDLNEEIIKYFYNKINEINKQQNNNKNLLILSILHPTKVVNNFFGLQINCIYIQLPNFNMRLKLIKQLTSNDNFSINDEELLEFVNLTNGFSISDLLNLIKQVQFKQIIKIQENGFQPFPVHYNEIKDVLSYIKPTITLNEINQYKQFIEKFNQKQ